MLMAGLLGPFVGCCWRSCSGRASTMLDHDESTVIRTALRRIAAMLVSRLVLTMIALVVP